MAHDKPLISVVLSFRNEEAVLPELIRRLTAVLAPLPLAYELIFVNDASTDHSLAFLLEQAQADRNIKIINMSRRFGVAECVLAGMQYAAGDAVVYMDADLQDPPELIPELIRQWQDGADVVHTTRTSRAGESALKLFLTDAAYYLIGAWADVPLPVEAGDFKLLSRRAVNQLLRLQERTPYLRGLVSWIGFKQITVPYSRAARAGGTTKFPLFRRILHDLANLRGPIGTLIIGLTSFSLFPLMIFLLAGILLIGGGGAAVLISLILTALRAGPAQWWWSLTVIVLLSGMQLMGIGVLGIYLGRIYQDVRGRPRYIIESTHGFDGPSEPANDVRAHAADEFICSYRRTQTQGASGEENPPKQV